MRIINYRGKWCAAVKIDGYRKRISLGNFDATDTPERCPNYPAAQRAAVEFAQEIAKPTGDTVREIFDAYLADTLAIAKDRMKFASKAFLPVFGNLNPEHITRQSCRDYVASRRKEGRKDGTIIKELSVLRAAINWSDPNSGAVFELPPPPEPKDRWLTRDEFKKLLDAAKISPHLQLFLHLALATGGRKEAILSMTWMQVRWDQDQIWLGRKPGGKARATVPMTHAVKVALLAAKKAATTEFVIEYKEGRVLDIKKAFAAACRRAKLEGVTPHVLRHSAAVWMAEAGVPFTKIAQYLGHTNSQITERVYARYAPNHLRDAADALEIG